MNPEQLRVPADVVENAPVLERGRRVRQDLFENFAHVERVSITLVVVDVPTCESGLIEMPRQNLLPLRQAIEAVSVVLDNGGVIDLLEEISSAHQMAIVS